MTNEKASKSLVSKLAHICGELGKMERKGRNEFHRYDYWTEDQLTAALRPKLAEANIYITTHVTDIITDKFTNQKGNEEHLVTVKTTHIIRDGDSEAMMTITGVGQGADPGDKGAYKAITGAMKYFLMKNFFISDNSDPEADAAGDKAREETHRPTKQYELKPASPMSKADLSTLKTWAEENAVSEEFILKLAAEGKMAVSEKTLDELKPGTVTRLLALRERILQRWLEANGVSKKTEPSAVAQYKEASTKPVEDAWPDEPQTESDEGVTRTPVMAGTKPQETLEDAGIENWGDVIVHFGKNKGTPLNKLSPKSLSWYAEKWVPKEFHGRYSDADLLLDAALCLAK